MTYHTPPEVADLAKPAPTPANPPFAGDEPQDDPSPSDRHAALAFLVVMTAGWTVLLALLLWLLAGAS